MRAEAERAAAAERAEAERGAQSAARVAANLAAAEDRLLRAAAEQAAEREQAHALQQGTIRTLLMLRLLVKHSATDLRQKVESAAAQAAGAAAEAAAEAVARKAAEATRPPPPAEPECPPRTSAVSPVWSDDEPLSLPPTPPAAPAPPPEIGSGSGGGKAAGFRFSSVFSRGKSAGALAATAAHAPERESVPEGARRQWSIGLGPIEYKRAATVTTTRQARHVTLTSSLEFGAPAGASVAASPVSPSTSAEVAATWPRPAAGHAATTKQSPVSIAAAAAPIPRLGSDHSPASTVPDRPVSCAP